MPSRKWEHLGCLVKVTTTGEKIEVDIYKKGHSVDLRRGSQKHLVHPINAAGIDGWIQEIDTVWNTGTMGWNWEKTGK